MVTTPNKELGQFCQDHQQVMGWNIRVQLQAGPENLHFLSASVRLTQTPNQYYGSSLEHKSAEGCR